MEGLEMKNMISRQRERFKVGKKIRIVVQEAVLDKRCTRPKKETCKVVGVYPNIVVFERPCGLTVSYTYQELISGGIIAK